MSDPHQREAAIFDAALQLPPDRRADHLDHVCGGDAPLRQRIEALLRACDRTSGILDAPAAPKLAQTANFSGPMAEKPGDRIGRYKLLQQIGEGGCGVVYMAEQEEPVRRRVALKVIKLGMDTKSVIARFDAERQALAMMDHPNIATVLDAGATETGRPYFVMELVRGMKITDYCDEARLSTRERLDLFIKVCQAIQHAHQKGIIHRDIKPSNILVTVNDGVAVPKVIDFGIAKATSGQQLTDKTIFTAFEQFIGTPAYMSPEQAVLTSVDIDTRSDIYALGVLLYELLTGKTPFDAADLLAAGLDEMRRTIREQEPERPSTRVTRELATATAGQVPRPARHERGEGTGRGAADETSPDPKGASSPRPSPPFHPGEGDIQPSSRRVLQTKELVSQLRGDLDWVVMKALEKDRARRYETANGLASDIQRHLDNEPVLACPPSALYRFQKTLRRHKLAFGAGCSIAAALLIGLGVSTWMFVREREATREQVLLRQKAEANEKTAQTEAARSQQVASFLKEMLAGVGPSAALGRDTAMLREILDKVAERVGTDLTNQPEVEADLRETIGVVYLELGEGKKAEMMFSTNLALCQKLWGHEHTNTAAAFNHLAYALRDQGMYSEAENLFRKAISTQQKLLGDANPPLANSLHGLAYALLCQRKFADSEVVNREALAMRKKLFGEENGDVSSSLNNLALVLEERGKIEEAEKMYRQSLTIKKKLNVAVPNQAMVLFNLGRLFSDQGRLAEAETMHREALELRRKVLGCEHQATSTSIEFLADVLCRQKKYAEAEPLWRERLDHARKFASGQLPSSLTDRVSRLERCSAGLGDCLRHQEKYAEAEKPYREALDSALRFASNDPPRLEIRIRSMAGVLRKQGKLAEAKLVYREALDYYRKGAERGDLETLNNLAWILSTSEFSTLRDGQSAVSLAEKAVAATKRKNSVYLDTLAAAYAEVGEFEKAVGIQKEAITLIQDGKVNKELARHLKLYESNSPCRAP